MKSLTLLCISILLVHVLCVCKHNLLPKYINYHTGCQKSDRLKIKPNHIDTQEIICKKFCYKFTQEQKDGSILEVAEFLIFDEEVFNMTNRIEFKATHRITPGKTDSGFMNWKCVSSEGLKWFSYTDLSKYKVEFSGLNINNIECLPATSTKKFKRYI